MVWLCNNVIMGTVTKYVPSQLYRSFLTSSTTENGDNLVILIKPSFEFNHIK